jgi:hypothetical protein
MPQRKPVNCMDMQHKSISKASYEAARKSKPLKKTYKKYANPNNNFGDQEICDLFKGI